MKTPRSRNEQRMAHCRGEVYRGCGMWPFIENGSQLEPPFEPFSWADITEWDLAISEFDAPYQGQFIDQLKRLFIPVQATSSDLCAAKLRHGGPRAVVQFSHYRDDEVTPVDAIQLLLATG